jgi:enoyl-CoA hydratase
MADFETFLIEQHGAIVLVTMNRPEKLNAMSPTFFRELPHVMDAAAALEGARAIVLTGAGRAFSAGGDIESFGQLGGTTKVRRHLRSVFDAFHSLERCELPVIGAINGVAYGGGTEITLACDMVIASDRATFGFREATVGLTPGYGLVRGPATIGTHWTRWLALSADIIDAGKALEIGLVQQVVPHDELMAAAFGLAARVAANAPLAVRVGKNFLNRANPAGLAESIEATALLFTTEDNKNAITAFVAKQEPTFEGR